LAATTMRARAPALRVRDASVRICDAGSDFDEPVYG
jgi:hypothetical protein